MLPDMNSNNQNKDSITSSKESYPQKISSFFNFWRISIPIILGLGVTIILIYRDFDKEAVRAINWAWYSFLWLFVAIFLMAVRHVSYMYRIRLLTNYKLNWYQSFQVIMLWEFASSITPSVVGGSAVALYLLNKEGIKMGKTTAIVMVTALLDELFYIIIVPILFLIVGAKHLFISDVEFSFLHSKFGSQEIFWIGYIFLASITVLVLYGVFYSPRGFKRILVGFCKLFRLKNLRQKAIETGDGIIATSKEMKNKSFLFWIKAFGATVLSWTARFLMVNFMLMAFFTVSDHLLIGARQMIMWVILLVTPTPGSSGAAEYLFPIFLGDFIPQGLGSTMALLWRLMSYYPYLFLGLMVLPIWLRRVYKRKKTNVK